MLSSFYFLHHSYTQSGTDAVFPAFILNDRTSTKIFHIVQATFLQDYTAWSAKFNTEGERGAGEGERERERVEEPDDS